MNDFLIAFNAVAPMFLVIMLGVLLKKGGLLGEDWVAKLNRLVYHVLLPCKLFVDISSCERVESSLFKLLAFCAAAIAASYILSSVVVRTVEKKASRHSAMIQASFRSNYVLIGLPVLASLYAGQSLGTPAIVAALTVPFFNTFAVLTFESNSGKVFSFTHTLNSLIKNPLIIGGFTGLLSLMLQIRLPAFLSSAMDSLSSCAPPLTLLVIGASLSLKGIRDNIRPVAFCTLMRLVALPLIAVTMGIICGFRNMELAVILAVTGTPTPVMSYTLVQQYGADENICAGSILATQLASCLTIFCWIIVLRQLGFI